jgi:hypothetical protein
MIGKPLHGGLIMMINVDVSLIIEFIKLLLLSLFSCWADVTTISHLEM